MKRSVKKLVALNLAMLLVLLLATPALAARPEDDQAIDPSRAYTSFTVSYDSARGKVTPSMLTFYPRRQLSLVRVASASPIHLGPVDYAQSDSYTPQPQIGGVVFDSASQDRYNYAECFIYTDCTPGNLHSIQFNMPGGSLVNNVACYAMATTIDLQTISALDTPVTKRFQKADPNSVAGIMSGELGILYEFSPAYSGRYTFSADAAGVVNFFQVVSNNTVNLTGPMPDAYMTTSSDLSQIAENTAQDTYRVGTSQVLNGGSIYYITLYPEFVTSSAEIKAVITQADALATRIESIPPIKFTGSAIEPTVDVSYANGATSDWDTLSDTEYTLDFKDNTYAGVASILATMTGASGYKFADAAGMFTIQPAERTFSTEYDESNPKEVAKNGAQIDLLDLIDSVSKDDPDVTLPKDGAVFQIREGDQFATLTDNILTTADYEGEEAKTVKVWVSAPATDVNNDGVHDITITDSCEITLSIVTKPSQTFAAGFATATEKTYGDASFTKAATLSEGNGAITYSSSDPTVATVNASTGAVTILKAGSTTIKATAAGTATHLETSAQYGLTVHPKELSITGLSATNRAYNGSREVALTGGTLTGAVQGDSVTCTIPTTGTVATAGVDSNKAVTVTKPALSGDDKDNYTLADITGLTVTISQADPSIGDVTYTGGDIYPSTAVADVNAALSRANTDVSGTLALEGVSAFTAGTRNYTWKFTPSDATNYQTKTGSIRLTVSQDALSSIAVTTDPSKKAYEYGDTFDLTGAEITATFASGSTLDVTDQVTFGALAVGQTDVTLTYQDKTCKVSGITVTKKKLDVTGLSWDTTGSPFTFDGSTKTVSLTGDVPTGVTVTKSDFRRTDVGDYTASASFALANGYSSDNYEIKGSSPITANWSITPATGTAGALTVSVKYDTTAAQTVDLSSFIPADCGSIQGDGITFAATADNDHIIASVDEDVEAQTASFTLASLAAGDAGKQATLKATIATQNYTDIEVTVTVTITGKDVPVVSAENITKTFDDQAVETSAISGTATFGGETVPGAWSFKGSPTIKNAADSGAKVVVFTPEDGTKYETVETSIVVTINKAMPTGTPRYTAITASGKTLADAALDVGTLTPAGGTIIWADAEGAQLADSTPVEQGKIYKWLYTPAAKDQGNYAVRADTIVLWEQPSFVGGDTSSSSSEETTTTVDGATQTTETASDGTVTTTTTWEDGKTSVAEKSPDGDVTITVTSPDGETIAKLEIPDEIPENSTGYVDVKENSWYEDSVNAATGLGLFGGTTETTFSPYNDMDRGMLVTVLHRLSGESEYGTDRAVFVDVPSTAYYADAANWANAAGIASGTEKGFEPNQSVSRQDMITMIYRYAMALGANPAETGTLAQFTDGANVSDYAKPAMQWAVAAGLINGKGYGVLDPKGTATRAEVATVLVKLVAYLKK